MGNSKTKIRKPKGKYIGSFPHIFQVNIRENITIVEEKIFFCQINT